MEQLQEEGRGRPRGALTVEQVLAALAEAQVEVKEPRQVLAQVHLARYCQSGTTASGLAVGVCEYADAQAAQAGREHSRTHFGQVAFREVLAHGNTILILRGSGTSPLEAEEGRRAAEAYTRLPLSQEK
jgi:hypothetical protein